MSANEQFFDDAQTAVSLTGNSNSTVLLVPEPFRSEGAHRVGGQLRGDKERLFSGRVWRKVPESDARSVRSMLSPTNAWFTISANPESEAPCIPG